MPNLLHVWNHDAHRSFFNSNTKEHRKQEKNAGRIGTTTISPQSQQNMRQPGSLGFKLVILI